MSEKIFDLTGQQRSVEDYQAALSEILKHTGGGGTSGGGGSDMEVRLSKLEEALTGMREVLSRIDGRLDRIDGRLDVAANDLSTVKISQARLEERMERVMDKARDMPTETRINSMLNHKLTILGIAATVIFGLLGYLKL